MGMTKEEIIGFVKLQGADLCGIADLSDKNDYIKSSTANIFLLFPELSLLRFSIPKRFCRDSLRGRQEITSIQ